MKRILALLLASLMLFTLVACNKDKEAEVKEPEVTEAPTDVEAEAPADETEPEVEAEDADATEEETEAEADADVEEEEAEVKEHSSDTLTVGTVQMDGFFINGFTNSSYDVAIKTLIGNYGKFYSTYVSDQEGEYVLDQTTNAKEPEVTLNEDGSKTYRFFLNPDLVWNDGEAITAKDYVFATLFAASPQWLVAGATTAAGDQYPGYEAYHSGESNSFPGVKYIDDQTFEVTLAAEFVPYFFETAAVASGPSPMHRFCPNLDIGEDGSSLVVKEGYEVSDADKDAYLERLDEQAKQIADKLAAELEQIDQDRKDYADQYSEEEADADREAAQKAHDEALAGVEEQREKVDSGDFDARDILLQANAYEVAQVYRYAPDVTCGPYNFVENVNQTVILKRNDKFIGDFEGDVPKIENIVQKMIPTDSDVDQLIAGDIDLAVSITTAELISKGRDAADEGKVDFNDYPRAGFGMIRFQTDLGATAHKGVRQAIGYLLNRDLFIQNFYGGYGAVVDGYYSLNDWMYKARGEEFEEECNHYTLNIEKANEVLDTTPYIYEKDGKTPWDFDKAQELFEENAEGFDYWRYDENGEQLVVNQGGAYPPIVELVNQNIPNNSKRVGMQYVAVDIDFPTLLQHLKNPDLENPKFTAFTMGVGFTPIFDPYYDFHSSQIGINNQDRVNDPFIDELMEKMRVLSPEDREEFADMWLEFQLWFNDYLPELPLYSNQYYDFYAAHVKNLETSPLWAWYDDICKVELD